MGLNSGDPLPSPFKVFERNRVVWRRSSVHMIAGQPGSQKTVLMLNIVDRMGKIPTLYISSDSDDFTVASRVYAMRSGETVERAEEIISKDPAVAYDTLREWDHVRFSFNSAPTIDHIVSELDAMTMINGEPPHHTVVDILMDVDYEGASEMNLWALMNEFKVLAREYNTAFTIVHHASEGAKGEPCPPRSAIMGKANQLPTLILTLNGNDDSIDVAVVKNRFGKADLTGRTFTKFPSDPARCKVQEPNPEAGSTINAQADWFKVKA